ncbi:hypothetical protein DEU34_3079 [Microbacterium sp. AG1240]|uniref:molecular chaperone DnaJ n=1 Tax=Microbacterium sp. AG1240 TaxID=2183992 RepID=UPI000EB3DA44|nr:molecular chaperone DnaJ [Microbacterium sp. AG1240]RKT31141.1 hypothetical protein DEU34_3079 [Microbacterium sp. AG1240]
MTYWPSGFVVAPMREWPGTMTARRRRSQFESTHFATPARLSRELRELGAKNPTLLIALRPEDFRLDGLPRASRVAAHPGIVLSFGSEHGPLSYPCDTFDRWEDNLRAIAPALEALRKVDRYGVTAHGEQHRGFLALDATAAPAGFADADAAYRWLVKLIGADDLAIHGTPAPAMVLRKAQRISHPDVGGDAATFQRVSLAEATLRERGLL